MKRPQANKINHILLKHGDERLDPYYWLNERKKPEVIQYLEEENRYTADIMKDTEELQNLLYEEMKSRYKKDDTSLPYFFNDYWYIVRYEEGKEYPIFCRKHQTLDADEEIILNSNLLADGLEFFEIGSLSISEDNKTAAYSYDSLSRRIYTIYFKDIETGEILKDRIENTTGKAVWSSDNQYVFYIRKNKNLRAFQIYRHKIGTSAQEDVLVYHEKDDTFDVNVFKTKSSQYIIISSSSTISDEMRFIPADNVFAQWQIIQPREPYLEYSVEHFETDFYIITNAGGATNFKLVKTPIEQTLKENWTEVVPHREGVLLEGFEIFNDYLVIEEREKGLLKINIRNWTTGVYNSIDFQDPTYTAYISINLDFNSEVLRYGYTSLTRPSIIYEYNMRTGSTKILKQQEVLGGYFKPEDYISERIWAPARDGQQIPISIVYHKNTPKSKNTPLLLYGYGSYGHTVDATFSNIRLSLLERGFIYAIAHIRGGEYLGREWYEAGKMLSKKNTFFDFIDASKFLIEEHYTSSEHLYAMGGSAGGLLIGAVINMEPKLFKGVIAQVPFVDVVTTMLDENIPLTTGEYDEWGNPNDAVYYHYMKSYSPYDNIEEKDYPHILITTGFHDSQVQYWEPAKWTAKLRDLKTDNNLLLLKTDMTSGHGGASGRFESLKDDAFEYAFLLKLENKIEVKSKTSMP
ncbi:prolyl oligopeptidase family serine peptidase [Elizabethkingia argentiflava]|uniref:Proline-specific endopeptidase n=1 Tax=Elizabethkingia argenteiflava TaxID=2681556 RepID=A0A845PYZ6_9FLAO|nr:S9 family peptidase [Elizabethkingia argenteiflava]NAW51667.1 prolyl oligopeptidase family serine peptidase [Elizabethkingia argenteiflava]